MPKKNTASSGTPHNSRRSTGPKATPQRVLVSSCKRSSARLPSTIWLKTENAISQPRAASCRDTMNSTTTAMAAATKTMGARLRQLREAAPFI